ncbi:isoprenylcysteine carboxylmethyltransferase family protein [Herminiimonas sp. CN]|uniref:methyltransferase family protein n=1 Tax=Herminiimonas sp. CN TaxID=1349818 RepID=UPI0004738E1D|nr:isoprenylcysteine carboxylmethyltransferase family protein [Herminiimonas sp. CN]
MSRLLVAAQFLLIVLIAWPSHAPALTMAGIALFALGLIAAAAALLVMPARTLSVLPEPRSGGELVTRGIYRHVRHPMYLGVLLCSLAACLAYGSMAKWGLLALLAGVLAVKIRREERLLLARFPAYAAYRQKTGALIPYLL